MKVVVIGASLNPRRYVYHAIKLLAEKNHEVIAIGKISGKIDDIKVSNNPTLIANVDTVTLYINPTIQADYYDHILALKPKRVIFNPGTENGKLVELLKLNGIEYQFSCTLIMLKTGAF